MDFHQVMEPFIPTQKGIFSKKNKNKTLTNQEHKNCKYKFQLNHSIKVELGLLSSPEYIIHSEIKFHSNYSYLLLGLLFVFVLVRLK